RHGVDLAVPGQQARLLLLAEDDQRQAAGRAVHAPAGDLQAPGARLLPQVREAVERPALEEALAHVRDAPLHVRLVLRVRRARRIGQEAAVLAVLQEAPRQPRRE